MAATLISAAGCRKDPASSAAMLPETASLPEVGYMPMPESFDYKSVFLHGRPRHRKYDAFWRKHPPMDTGHRAKIFAPFDALRGFSGMIQSLNRGEDPDQVLRRGPD